MRTVVPSWRVSDAVAYDSAIALAARSTAAEGDGSVDASPLVRALQINGFDRASVDALLSSLSRTAIPDERQSSLDAQVVLEREILPAVFGRSVASDSPRLVLLGGEAGSGRSRAIGQLSAENEDGIAVVSPTILRAFLPDTAPTGSVPASDPDEIVAGWLGACLRYGRDQHFPVLVDAPFRSPDVTVGLIESFRQEGFVPTVAVVAVSRAEILMAATSAHLHQATRGVGLYVGAVDRSIEDTRAVLATVEDSGGPTRVVVIDRNGDVTFDHTAHDGSGGAVAARDRAAASPMSTLQATQWLSELRRITEFVDNPASRATGAAPALLALQEAALREVIPRLSIPSGSMVARQLESRIAGQLVPSRRSTVVTKPARPTGPEAVPAWPGTSGPSR